MLKRWVIRRTDLKNKKKMKAWAPVLSKNFERSIVEKAFRKFFTSSTDEVCGSSFSGSLKNQGRISISFFGLWEKSLAVVLCFYIVAKSGELVDISSEEKGSSRR